VERISSRQNAAVKRFRKAAQGKDPHDGVLLDGAHLVREALSAGIRLEAVAFAEPIRDEELNELVRHVTRAGVRTLAVAPQVMSAMSPVRTPSGVVGLAQVSPAPLAAVLQARPQLVVVLDEVQDPGNVGAAIRAADGCGATGVIATSGTADPLGWKALRGAMGSAFRLPIATRITMDEVRAALKAAAIPLVATVPRGGTLLPLSDLKGPAALLFGGEGGGLSADITQAADARLTIPMRPQVESLNVAVAAGIVLYEAARQRGNT
jgi:TrmH family RNA methyltransferase